MKSTSTCALLVLFGRSFGSLDLLSGGGIGLSFCFRHHCPSSSLLALNHLYRIIPIKMSETEAKTDAPTAEEIRGTKRAAEDEIDAAKKQKTENGANGANGKAVEAEENGAEVEEEEDVDEEDEEALGEEEEGEGEEDLDEEAEGEEGEEEEDGEGEEEEEGDD